jgi:PKD repeat protein
LTDASLPGTAAIASRTWAFGDGTAPVAGGSLAHRFPEAGTYTVTLTVVDAGGLSSTAEKTITVTAAAPPAAALTVACVSLTCDFSDGSTAGSFPIASRSWSFGDGSAIDNGPASGTHVFALGGMYAITVTVTDSNGLSASASHSVTVEPPNLVPTAAFAASCADLTCTFTDGSFDPDGTITGWQWAFGAGTSTVTGPTFKFAAPGSYPVTLTVTDDDGATAALTTVVTVTGRLHVAYGGSTLKWSNASGSTSYWSAEVTVSVHGLDERPIAGASVTAAWSGAVSKTATCVTNASGSCTLKSGTLSYGRSTVTLKVTSVVSPAGAYILSENHTNAGVAATALTLMRP